MITFETIFGQEAAVDSIRRAYLSDRLPHGLIFTGPIGVGKGTTAMALGGLFLCGKPKGAKPCGACESCKLMAAGNHPDLRSVYRQLVRIEYQDRKARDLSVHVIRTYLVDPANLKPSMGRGRVFIIEEADLMNAEAQNALLKTLEEPAGRTLIILLTDQPNALLATIRSRCQQVRFAPLDEAVVKRELHNRGIQSAAASDAARFSQGSLGLAIKWIEDGVIPAALDLEKRIDAMLAGQPSPDLPDWLKAAAEQYAEKQINRDELSSKDQANREGLGLYLSIMALVLGRKLRDSGDAGMLESICSAVDAIVQAEQYLDANVTISLIFQQLAVRLDRLFAATVASGGR